MVRLARAELFDPSEVAILHVMGRVVRRCFLFGFDPVSGKNFDHRKDWIEERLRIQAASFGIDLLSYAVLSNHFHLILRSRPDVVATWDDTEVARRWLMLCPKRKNEDRSAMEPSEFELNSIRNDPDKLATIRTRLSDVSWWMRLLCQNIGTRANQEDREVGRFFQGRFRAVRILDEETLLACSAYVDLNPIRAALAATIEMSEFTSVQRRIESLRLASGDESRDRMLMPDCFLAPLSIDERNDPIGPCASLSGKRCSDKGFISISKLDYLALLDATARITREEKTGATSMNQPPIFDRLRLDVGYWKLMVRDFGRVFSLVAGTPKDVYEMRSLISKRRFNLKRHASQIPSAG